MEVEFRMPDDQDGGPSQSSGYIGRNRACRRGCCIRLAVVGTILSFIASQTIWYTFYFHSWNSSLIEFEQTHPGKVDSAFLKKLSWIIVPAEAWLLTSFMGAIAWGVGFVLKKMGISPRQRIGVTVSTLFASAVFGVCNVAFYYFHQFSVTNILTYQTGSNTTCHLLKRVTTKLWETFCPN